MKTAPLYELRKVQSDFPQVQLHNSDDAAKFIKQFYSDDIGIYESCFILLLNKSNKTIGYAKISQGGITGTVVDVRIIAKYCIESLATGCILAHNHPSGGLTPSQADHEITRRTREALAIFDCQLIDHLILTEESFYSFADEGKI